MLVKDQLNRTLQLSKPPIRIVSLVPSQTELLVDLGLENKIVGVTKFCVHPKSLRKGKMIVGGTKDVHYDKIKALRPDIIICNKEENTKEIVTACEKIAPVWVSDILTIEDSLEMISSLGAIFNVANEASGLVTAIISEKDRFADFVQRRPLQKVAYLIWKNPYMAASTNTFINSVLHVNRYENIVSDADSRYPEVTIDFLKQADLVLLSSEPYPFKGEDVIQLEELLQKQVQLVDGAYFSWYGSRLRDAFLYFRTL